MRIAHVLTTEPRPEGPSKPERAALAVILQRQDSEGALRLPSSSPHPVAGRSRRGKFSEPNRRLSRKRVTAIRVPKIPAADACRNGDCEIEEGE